MTDDLIRKGLKLKAGANQEVVDKEATDEEDDNDDDPDPDPHPGNRGKLQMDADRKSVCRERV